jgi:N-acetylglucosaminyldiphosphoundecaprenol N-acetyl-beta-D-mannosaminyltransferase
VTAQNRYYLDSVPIDAVTQLEAIDYIATMVGSVGGTVFTPNVDHVVLAQKTPRLRRAYQATRLSLVDGMAVLWACRLLGWPVPEKVSGADIVRPLIARAARVGWRVYLLGGGPGVAELAAFLLTREFPGLSIVGIDDSIVDMEAPRESRRAVTERIRAARADLVLVALGTPKGELWAAEASAELPATVIVGVGAALDFLTGVQKRAPSWLSNLGFEWLYRLCREPARLWQRYLWRGPAFLPILLRCLRRQLEMPQPEIFASNDAAAARELNSATARALAAEPTLKRNSGSTARLASAAARAGASP